MLIGLRVRRGHAPAAAVCPLLCLPIPCHAVEAGVLEQTTPLLPTRRANQHRVCSQVSPARLVLYAVGKRVPEETRRAFSERFPTPPGSSERSRSGGWPEANNRPSKFTVPCQTCNPLSSPTATLEQAASRSPDPRSPHPSVLFPVARRVSALACRDLRPLARCPARHRWPRRRLRPPGCDRWTRFKASRTPLL